MTILTQNLAMIDTGNNPFVVVVNQHAQNYFTIDLTLVGNAGVKLAEYEDEETAFAELKQLCIGKQTNNFYEFRTGETNETSEENA